MNDFIVISFAVAVSVAVTMFLNHYNTLRRQNGYQSAAIKTMVFAPPLFAAFGIGAENISRAIRTGEKIVTVLENISTGVQERNRAAAAVINNNVAARRNGA